MVNTSENVLKSTYEIARGIAAVLGIPALLVLGGITYTQLSDLQQQVGILTGEMKAVDVQFANADKSRQNLGSLVLTEFQKTNRAVDEVRATVELSQMDLGRILVSMGTVPRGNVFDAAIIDGDVWIFPGKQSLAMILEQKGMKRKQVNHAITGYPVIPASMLRDER